MKERGQLVGLDSQPRPRARGPRARRASGLALLVGLVLLATACEETPEAQAKKSAGKTAADSQAAPEGLSEFHWNPREAWPSPSLFFFLGSQVRDPVEQILDDAEAALRRGQEHYQAGHLEAARQEFDQAVDSLLAFPLPLRKDPRLLFGFDSVVDRIHHLELAALRDASPTDEPPDVPAAIEQIAPLTFPLDPELRRQVEQELGVLAADLPLTVNERVLSVVGFFQTPKGRRVIQNGLRRAGRYRELITSILEEEGLPQDLVYLAQAESGFQPHARSRMRAVGLWQFMSWRAREYGLHVDWWVDERRDPIKSTRAAARHLRDLYEQFGDWHLALAAYNGGPLRVQRALRRAGSDADYWTLVRRRLLPRETRNFVPIILAISLVAKAPARYGVDVEPDPPLRFETVKVPKPTDLRRIAEVIGVDARTLQQLNPHLLRGVTPNKSDFELYVPPGTAETLVAELPKLPEAKRVLWPRHRVRRGETLSHIAGRYGSSSYAIAQANGISLRSLIYPGQVLVIPRGSGYRSVPRATRTSGGALVYTVRPGDSLSAIAARHRTTPSALARANGISARSFIHPGDRLVIPEGSSRTSRSAAASHTYNGELRHRVRRGESLSSIAARYGTSASAIARANGMSLRSLIHPGDILVVPTRGVPASRAAASRNGERRHRVRRGETLWDLSRRYGVSVSDLRDSNPYLEERQLRAGDNLTIPE